MRRFTEVLLLVACTFPPSLFVNGLLLFSPTVNYRPEPRNAVIRDLLVPRQGLCTAGFVGCEASGCCPVGWPCCSDGNCCDPTNYCVLASNGIIGCCPIGELCSGPAGNPTTINVPPPTLPLPTPTTNPLPPIQTSSPASAAVPSPDFTSRPLPTILTSSGNPASTSAPTINSVLPSALPVVPPTSSGTVNTGVPAPTFSSRLLPTYITSSPSPANPTSTSGLSAAGRAQLYRPLLFFFGILLAVIY